MPAFQHVVTRSVRGSAAMLDVTSGPEVGSFINPAPKDCVFLDDVGANPGKLRIAWSSNVPYGAPSNCAIAPSFSAADQDKCAEWGQSFNVEKAKELLAEAGYGSDNPVSLTWV